MKNKLLASILTACMLLTMLPTAAFAAETEAEPGTEQTASGPENAGNQPDGGGDDAGGPDNNRSSETANVSSREELEAALKDSSVSTINIDSNIDMGDTDWNGVQIEKGRTLVINGNDNTISGLKVHKAYMGPNGSGIPGDGGSADCYTAWIADNKGTLTINDLTFSDAEIDANPLTTEKQSTGSSILAVVVANNSGELTYNNVNVVGSTVRGYSKVGLLHGFTQNNGSFVANKCSVENSQVVLEADGSDKEAALSGILIGYDGNNAARTNGIKMSGCEITINSSVQWNAEIQTKPDGTRYVSNWGLTSPTYTHGSNGTDSVAFVAEVGGYQYETLPAAIAAAQDGETVKLLENITEADAIQIPQDADITLNLNGQVLMVTNGDALLNNGVLTILDSLTGGKIISENSGAIGVGSGSTTTIQSGTFESVEGAVFTSKSIGATINIEGGTFSASDNAVIAGNGSSRTGDPNVINIKGGTFNGSIKSSGYVACGIYAPWKDQIKVSGGTFNITGGAGIVARAGTVTVTGGEFKTTGNVTGMVGDSRNVVPCAALVFDSAANYPGMTETSKISVSGGTFISDSGVDAVNAVENGDTSRISIASGIFSSDVKDYCATGYTAVKDETTGLWTVKASEGMVAKPEGNGDGSVSAEVGGEFAGTENGNDGVEVENSKLEIDVTTGGENKPNENVNKTTVTIQPASLESVKNSSVSNVEITTDVGVVTLDKAAWDSITENAGGSSVTLTVEKKADGSSPADWTVSAVDSKGETVFSSEDQRDGEISISVPYTKENLNDGDQVVVYYIGENGQLEAMTTTYNQENKTLTWSTDHLSDFGDVIIGPDTEAVWISGTELKAGTLADALSAVASKGGTIDLVNNATLADAKFVISKNVTIQKSAVATNVPAISATVAAGETAGAFTVTENASLTLNGVKLVVQGTANTETDGGKYDGTGIILNNSANGTGGKFILNNAEVELTELQRGMVFQVTASNLASIEMNSSKLTIQNIDGNASNGGMWSIKNDSTVIVSHCGNHGLSVQEITVDHSMIHVDDAGYVGVLAQKVELKNGAEVSVTNSGNQLPLDSQWAPNGEKYENAVEIKKGGSLSVDETSSMELTGNKSNSILIADQGSLDNQGTITGEIVIAGSTQHLVKVLVDGKIVAAATVADKGSYTLPAAPSKSGYDFKGWSNGTATYAANAQVENITADMEFTAKWEKQKDDSSSGSSDNERTYAIITEDDGNGSVTVSADEASAGTRITVTVKPDAGYELDELTVTDAKNKDLKLTKRSETTYTFHMADSKVTVEASFAKDGTVQQPDTRFDDVAKSAWYHKAVEYVAENGIMSGVSAREFAPNAGFSRAMLAQTLYAMSGKPAVKAESTFADVAASAWYADAVNWAAEKGYVSGVGDGKFAPDASVTREQMALILYRYAGSPDASGMAQKEFADSSSVSAYAVDAIRWAVHEGLISGMENNTLAPQGTATRAQVAQILMNFHQKLDK